MKVWLQTRGETQDYAFLNEAPPEFWWGSQFYKDCTSFEQPTLILERYSAEEWRCFMSAIPSTRKDRVNTQIRYSLVLEGNTEDRENLFKFLGHVLRAFRSDPPAQGELTTLLDEAVGKNADKWLEKKTKNNEENSEDEEAKGAEIQKFLAELKEKFSDLEQLSLDSKLESVIKKIEEFLPQKQDTPKLIGLFNFIGSLNDSLIEELKTESRDFSHRDMLILPSPVAGGNIVKPFSLNLEKRALPCAENREADISQDKKAIEIREKDHPPFQFLSDRKGKSADIANYKEALANGKKGIKEREREKARRLENQNEFQDSSVTCPPKTTNIYTNNREEHSTEHNAQKWPLNENENGTVI